MLERAHLKLLVALREQGSLTAAAEALHLSQSALSHTVRKLEQQLELKIWEKTGRQIRLTQAGEYLLRFATEVLPRFDEAEAALKAYSEGKKGKLRMGMECHPCYEWLMGLVPDYLAAWPDVDLDVIQQFRFDGLAALENHHIDILITSDPINKDGLLNIPVLNYELLLAVKKDDSSQAPRFIKPKALADQVLFSFPVEKSRLDVFTYFLIPAAIEPKQHVHIETIEVMLQLVASGRGVCTLPDWLLRKYQTQHKLDGVRLGKEGVKKQLHLVLREEDRQIDYLSAFVQSAGNN